MATTITTDTMKAGLVMEKKGKLDRRAKCPTYKPFSVKVKYFERLD